MSPLPRWMEPLLDAKQQREVDRWAIEQKEIPSLELMERAGAGLADLVAQQAPTGRIAVVCGKGNNGGDGLVAARLLRQAGREVDVLCVWPPAFMTPDAKANFERLPPPAAEAFEAERLSRAQTIVDALLGTGFSGAARDPVDKVIAAINGARARVIAADMPSGVNGSTGEVEGEAVQAVATATFHRSKPGLWVNPGKRHAGHVHAVDIGIPRGSPVDPYVGLIGPTVLRGLAHRNADSTKFTSGTVVVLGGSRGLTGAPMLAAAAAMRAGAGYVSIATAGSLEPSLALRPLEVMVRALPEEDGSLSAEAVEPTLKAIKRADAVVLGPGLGRSKAAVAFAREMYERIDVPLVIDADALNALEGVFPEDIPQRRWPTVLTPHSGELGRMLGVPSEEVDQHRMRYALQAAQQAKAMVVLKGDDTLIASAAGRVVISRGNAPALATAGTGDVLAGVIAALLARRLPAAVAACAGVYMHVRAGQIAAEPHGPDGVIATDVIRALPAALGR